jgi:hypothetical protein
MKMNLIETIQLGLRRGYYQNRQFNDGWEGFDDKMIEYLLTVYVAIELYDYTGFGKPTKIKLEYPLWQFYNRAFPENKWSNEMELFGSSEFLKREYKKKRSKHRIDIVVMNDDGKHLRSLHGIELKAINTYDGDTINDLNRLSNSMITVDHTDANSITSCYSAFIKFYRKQGAETSDAELQKMRNDTISEIERILDTQIRNKPEYANLIYTLYNTPIDSESSESYLKSYSGLPAEDRERPDLVSTTGEVLGVVIEISRK